MTQITIPTSVTSIGDRAFLWCDSLMNITYTGTKDQWKAIDRYKNDETKNDWRGSIPWSCKVYCTDGTMKMSEAY